MASIGATSIPLGVMPDPADVNADPAATSGAINVLSLHGLTMMFHGMVSVKEGLLPVRTLADTGASHCYVSQAYVEKAGIPVRPSQNWLKLANNSQAISHVHATLLHSELNSMFSVERQRDHWCCTASVQHTFHSAMIP